MRIPRNIRQTLGCAAVVSLMTSPVLAQQSVGELQARFDREDNSVKKAKLMVKLGEAQFEQARRAGKEGDNNTVDATMEKYRDNIRAALEALKKQRSEER